MNAEEEEGLISFFKQQYAEFPTGTLRKVIPPPTAADYQLTTVDGRTIGIELTEVFHSEESQRVSSSGYTFTNLLLEKLKGVLPFSFSLDIDIDDTKGIPKSKRNEIIAQLIDFCTVEFLHLQNGEHLRLFHIGIDLLNIADQNVRSLILSRGYRNLPDGIKSISVYRYDGTESWNARLEGGAVPNLTINYLESILTQKDNLIGKYEPCDEFWLVIKEGNYHAGSFNKIELELPIRSAFNKVFLCRVSRGIILKLK